MTKLVKGPDPKEIIVAPNDLSSLSLRVRDLHTNSKSMTLLPVSYDGLRTPEYRP